MNRIYLVVSLLLTIGLTGCFMPVVSFDKNPPHLPITAEELPAKVERIFSNTYPGVQIEKIETWIWGPKAIKFYQLTFNENGKTMQVVYDQRGKISRPAATIQNDDPQDASK